MPMSWRTHIEEARPPLDRLTPVEASRVIEALAYPYLAESCSIPVDHIKAHAPRLYAMYETIALLDKAAYGRVDMEQNAPDIAWRHLAGFWQEIDTARKADDPQVKNFADHFADAARQAIPNRGWQRL